MEREDLKKVLIYTDGACYPNNGAGVGGWGAVFVENNEIIKEIYGGESITTNNKMEMMGAIEALKSLPERMRVLLITDSKYLMNGAQFWVKGWKRNGWQTKSGEPVKNKELWEELDNQLKRHVVDWKWVKGHNGNKWNERADQLACKGKEEAKLLKKHEN